MEHKQYQPGAHKPLRHGPHGGPGRVVEKPKDLLGTWKKLLGYCRSYLPALIIALFCAVIGTVLTLLGPDKLSDLTDQITAGIQTGVDLYAVAAIAGAMTYALLTRASVHSALAYGAGWAVTVSLRMLATVFRWNLPKAFEPGEP